MNGRAQWETNQATLLGENEQAWKDGRGVARCPSCSQNAHGEWTDPLTGQTLELKRLAVLGPQEEIGTSNQSHNSERPTNYEEKENNIKYSGPPPDSSLNPLQLKRMEGRGLRQFDAVLPYCADCQRKAQKEGLSRRQRWRLSLPILPRGSALIHAFVCA
jgi:hypothetical protein